MKRALKDRILHMGNGTEPKDLDPHLVSGVTEHNILSALLEGLVSLHPQTLAPMPAAAKSWSVNHDLTRYTFHLQANGKWSNGDNVTADDFVWSWRRILSPSLGASYAYQLFSIKNAEQFYKGEISDFSFVGVKAINSRTLEVELNHPTPYFLSLLSHFSTFPVHKETILEHGTFDQRGSKWTQAENFVGNGPFTLKTWRLNHIIEVEKNPMYWDSEKVWLNGIRFYPIDNLQTEERMFRTGGLHIASSIPPDKINTYLNDRPNNISIEPYLGTYYYRLNVDHEIIKDANVRNALSLAIDRQTIVDSITKGGQIPAHNYVPPDTAGYNGPKGFHQFDVATAKKLLAKAGYPKGKDFPKIELLYNTSDGHRRIAVAIQQMWKKHLQIDVVLENQDWKVFLDRLKKQDYAIARAGWIGDYPDPNTFLDMFVTDGGNNQTGWSNKEYDALIKTAAMTGDPEKRQKLLYDAESILLEEAPIIPIYTYTRVQLKDTSLQGWENNILDRHPYKYLYLADPLTAAQGKTR